MHPVRVCVACTQSDDHPRHQVGLPDGSSAYFHFDCHSLLGCEHCTDQLEGVGGVEGNPKGQALRDHLWTTGPAPDQPGWTAPVDETVKG
jgi:hypothetical protein